MKTMKICNICGSKESKKWYTHNGGYICQKDYRHLHYVKTITKSKEYQIEYYRGRGKNKGICHQKVVRDSLLEKDLAVIGKDILNTPLEQYTLSLEPFSKDHRKFIETYEWLGTVGNSPKWTFVARCNGHIAGIVLFNEPNKYSTSILSIKSNQMECLIQRGACASWAHKHLGSKLIKFGCRWLVKNTEKRIFVAYSDPLANEIGTIYQACGFDFLGQNFGTKYLYKYNGKTITAQSLRRTSVLKKFLNEHGVAWDKNWEKPNGFKDISKLPKHYKEAWYAWGDAVIATSKKIEVKKKGKYVLVLGINRREQKYLNKLKIYEKKEYPKRIDFSHL